MTSRYRRYVGPKRVLLLIGYLAVVLGGWQLHSDGLLTASVAQTWTREHPAGSVVLFLAVYVLTVLTTLPTLPFNLAAGVLWGPVLGGVLSAAAASTGAIIAFLAARALIGQPLARRVDVRSVASLQDEFDRMGWHLVAFVRINPVFPTGIVNYVFGLTSIGLSPYALATFAFILPSSVLVAWIGSSMGSLLLEDGSAAAWNVWLGISAAATLLVGIRFVARFLSRGREPRAPIPQPELE